MRGRILVGIVLLAAGILWLADLAGYHVFPGGFGTWWPLLVVLLGVVQLASSPWNWLGGLFLIVTGALLQAWRLGAIGGDWWMLVGASAVVFAGIAIVTAPWRHRRWRERWGDWDERWERRRMHHRGDADEAVFANVQRAFDGEFRGAHLRTVFGQLRIDMTRATLPPEGATLRLESIFGSTEVRVPAGWRVVVQGNPVGGQIRNDVAAGGAGPTLTVQCEAVFGNVEVRN